MICGVHAKSLAIRERRIYAAEKLAGRDAFIAK